MLAGFELLREQDLSEYMSGNWIVPFEGRNHSDAYKQNFLWCKDSIYVMDNHRAALWCWLQKIDLNSSHSILHIDRHTDTLQSRLDEWLDNLPSLQCDLQIDEYLDHKYKCDHYSPQVFRWDNYLSIYLAKFGTNIDKCYFATHNDGDLPNYKNVLKADIWAIPENLGYWLNTDNKPWVVNIDLDYFFWQACEHPDIMVSDNFLSVCFEALKDKIKTGDVAVTTISLTPHEIFTGGWENSEKLAYKILNHLGVDFKLPTV